MTEAMIIEYCSPTLANIKTANLFSMDYTDISEVLLFIDRENRKLNKKDVYFELLAIRGGRALIYVFRKIKLERDLKRESAVSILKEIGYSDGDVRVCLEKLRVRIVEERGFPHEIGLFLGYPPEDVLGFIKNRGLNYKCSGCWKVYCNEGESKKCFEKYKKCRKIYCNLYNSGRPITALTVNKFYG